MTYTQPKIVRVHLVGQLATATSCPPGQAPGHDGQCRLP